MNLALKILFFSLIIDLSGSLGVRDIGLLISLPFLFLNKKNKYSKKHFCVFSIVLVIYPAILLLKSSLDYTTVTRTQFFATYQMFIFYLVLSKLDYKKILYNFLDVIKFVQILVLILFFGNILQLSFFENILYLLGKPFDGSYFGYLRIGDFKFPQVYLKSTLIFVYPAIHFFIKKRYIHSLFSITLLLVSMSKAGFVLAFLGILIFSLRRFSITKILYISIIITIFSLYLGWYLDILYNIQDSYTAIKRLSQLDWFISYFVNNPITFFIGQGFGHFFVIDRVFDFAIELDHLDTIRKYGFLWFLIISLPFIKSLFSIKKNTELYFPYLFLFFAVGTNPLIITNLFFILTYIIIKSFSERSNNSNTPLEERI